MRAAGVLRHLLDAQQVRDDAVRSRLQRSGFRQGHAVVRQRAVDLGAGDEQDAAYARGRRGVQDGPGASHVHGAALGRVPLEGQVEGQVHDGVDTDQPLGEQRVADVTQAPDDSLDRTAAQVHGDDLADLVAGAQPLREQRPHRAGRTGHRDGTGREHDRAGAVGAPWCPRLPAGRLVRGWRSRRVGSRHRPATLVTVVDMTPILPHPATSHLAAS